MSDPALLFAELGRYTSHFELRPVDPTPFMEMSNDPKITFLASISAKLSGKFVFFQTKHGDTYVVGPYEKNLDRKAMGSYEIRDRSWSVDRAYESIFYRALPMGQRWHVPVGGGTSWRVQLLVEATSEDDAERAAQSYLSALTDKERLKFLIEPQEDMILSELHSSGEAEELHLGVCNGLVQKATSGYDYITFETPCDS